MPNRSADSLFVLIKSLQRGEKRAFKLYIKRHSSNEDLKIVKLFDVLDGMAEYDDAALLQKVKSIRKDQLAARKAHLYKQILASLRLLESGDNVDLQLQQHLGNARILYNKGLYIQSLKVLDKAKEVARAYNQNSYLVPILFLEKKIESLHITRSLKDRARDLSTESNEAIERLSVVSQLSNLALELYGWFINYGHARNGEDVQTVEAFFKANLAKQKTNAGFYERLYLYQAWCWYAFIRQDFLSYYRYTQKWVDLFGQQPAMIAAETSHYIKGLHNLLSAHFDLKNFERFDETLNAFETFAESEAAAANESNTVQTFIYLNTARINRHFLYGSFSEGVKEVPAINAKLKAFAPLMDRHRVLVFYYKIASLYFGSGDYDNAVHYLNKIINWKVDLRSDLQAYARMLHLIAHYELGNDGLLEYLIKSVYRFMAKMENLGPVEEDLFRFLRKAFDLSPSQLRPEFEKLLATLKSYENNHFASRAFAYLDVISWLESKLSGQKVEDVIRNKAAANKRSRTASGEAKKNASV